MFKKYVILLFERYNALLKANLKDGDVITSEIRSTLAENTDPEVKRAKLKPLLKKRNARARNKREADELQVLGVVKKQKLDDDTVKTEDPVITITTDTGEQEKSKSQKRKARRKSKLNKTTDSDSRSLARSPSKSPPKSPTKSPTRSPARSPVVPLELEDPRINTAEKVRRRRYGSI